MKSNCALILAFVMTVQRAEISACVNDTHDTFDGKIVDVRVCFGDTSVIRQCVVPSGAGDVQSVELIEGDGCCVQRVSIKLKGGVILAVVTQAGGGIDADVVWAPAKKTRSTKSSSKAKTKPKTEDEAEPEAEARVESEEAKPEAEAKA